MLVGWCVRRPCENCSSAIERVCCVLCVVVSPPFCHSNNHNRPYLPAPLSLPPPPSRFLVLLFSSPLFSSRSYSRLSPSSRKMLSSKVWAIVGDALNKEKVAHEVLTRLTSCGRTVYVVNPRDASALPSLLSIPNATSVQCVNLIMSPKYSAFVIPEMRTLGIKNLFIQPGAGTPDLIAKAKKEGITVHEGCVLVEMDE